MGCTGGCGKSRSMANPMARPSLMKSSNTNFNFGPYGSKTAKTIVGRVKPSSVKSRKK